MSKHDKVINELNNVEVPEKEAPIEETASLLFQLYYPKYAQLVDQLSSNSMRRLLKAIVAVPLEDATLNLDRPEEKTAYAVLEKLMISKMSLVLYTLMEHEANLKTNQEEKKESTNG